MKIIKKLNQNRRDFYAIYQCEHCGDEYEGSGYDDANFHENVIPAMKCEKCGKISDENYVSKETVYPEGMQI